ncbi:MAG: alanine racemase [Alphaproteobacteria bacterium]|jgi:alanine racemase
MPPSKMTPGPVGGAGGLLTIDLAAIAANWKMLQAKLGTGVTCGAVVKADAYGLGLAPVARALKEAGCATFFVAQAAEGLALRAILPESEIYIFNGVDSESAGALAEAHLTPVLNHPGQIKDWREAAARVGHELPAFLHVDTGMTRLGLAEDETVALATDPGALGGLRLTGIMSHLACADQPGHALNGDQLERFTTALSVLAPLGQVRASLTNSSGIFLDPAFHFDLARPGAALYGITPQADGPNPMAQVVKLQGKILQTRVIDTPRTVGYGATHRAERGRHIATVAVGYADGYLRSLSDVATAHMGDIPAPVVGRVSMDLITVDVTDIPPKDAHPGALVDLIGPHHSVDALARQAGTIGYEILTMLGGRFERHYLGEQRP